MASERTSHSNAPKQLLSLATTILVVTVAIVALAWRNALALPIATPNIDRFALPAGAAPSAPSELALSSIPLPDSSYTGKVVDPGSYAEGVVVSAGAAVDAARAGAPNLVGADPLVRLMEVTSITGPGDSERLDGLYWVILSPDASVWVSGPHNVDTSDDESTFYGWVFVDMKGGIVQKAAQGYPTGEMTPPALPIR